MQKKSWLKELKLSIINKNFQQIEILSKNIPSFNTLKESQEALALIEQATTLLKKERGDTLAYMQKLQKTKEYLK